MAQAQPVRRDIVHISGPITGQVAEAETALKGAGYVIAPRGSAGYTGELSEAEVWQLDLRGGVRAVSTAGAVALLPGWQGDRRAALEVYLATQIGIECQPVAVWLKRAQG